MRPVPGLLVAVLLAVAAVFAIAAPPSAPCDQPATTILIVRHAERAGAQLDSLSAEGVARAQELVRVASRANVKAIYHSDTRRTRDTALPLATALKIKPEEYPAKEIAPLIERILREHAGQSVLIVGHSNTVPMIIAAAGAPAIPDLDEREYDRLFIVNVTCRDRPSLSIELEYGAPSPR